MGELTSIGSSNHCSLKVGSGSGGNNTGSFGVAIAGRGGGGGGSATQKPLTFKCGPHQATMEASSLYFPWLLNDILNPGRTESFISWNWVWGTATNSYIKNFSTDLLSHYYLLEVQVVWCTLSWVPFVVSSGGVEGDVHEDTCLRIDNNPLIHVVLLMETVQGSCSQKKYIHESYTSLTQHAVCCCWRLISQLII